MSIGSVAARRKNDAGRQLNQRLKAPAIQRQVLGKLTIHDSADCGIGCIHQRRSAFHRHDFCHRANLKAEILLEVILDVYRQARDIDHLEARGMTSIR